MLWDLLDNYHSGVVSVGRGHAIWPSCWIWENAQFTPWCLPFRVSIVNFMTSDLCSIVNFIRHLICVVSGSVIEYHVNAIYKLFC